MDLAQRDEDVGLNRVGIGVATLIAARSWRAGCGNDAYTVFRTEPFDVRGRTRIILRLR